MKKEQKMICVGIDSEVYWILKQAALNKRITVRSLVNDLLKEYINKDPFTYSPNFKTPIKDK